MKEDLDSLNKLLERVEIIGKHASDHNINELEDLINSEILRSENSNLNEFVNTYLSDLKNTKYDLITLIENRNMPRIKEENFQNVIMHFEQDLINEIYRIKSSIDT